MPKPEAGKKKPRKHVLVVDDQADLAEMFAEALLLEESGRFSVDVAFNGLHALEVASRHVPHTVLMDIEMPLMNGFDGAEALRLAYIEPRLHLIAMSANPVHVERVKQGATHFDHAMLKPFEIPDLLAIIDAGPPH